MRYCVVEASQLFEAVRAKLEGRGDTAAWTRRLIETEGIFQPETSAVEAATTDATSPAEA
jgi:hypothetical protein